MPIEVGAEFSLYNRQHIPDKRRSASHPLVIGPPAVVIRAIEPRFRKPLHQPAKKGFVANVHPHCHLWLLPVSAERPLADQQAYEHPSVEVRKLAHPPCFTRSAVSPYRRT